MELLERIASYLHPVVLRLNRYIILLLAVIFSFMIPQVIPFSINNTLDTLLEQGDSLEKDANYIKSVFGNIDEIIVLAFTSGNLFTEKNLRLIVELTDRIERLDGIKNVFSLATTPYFRNEPDGTESILITTPLLDMLPADGTPASDEVLEKIKKLATSNELFRNNIMSGDGRTTAFNIIYERDISPEKKEELVVKIKELIANAEQKTDGKFYLTGMHVFMETTGKNMERDVLLFSSLSVVVLFLTLLVIFRSSAIAFLGILAAGVANGLLFITLHLLGRRLSISTTPVPAITMGLATAYSLHFFVAKREGKIDNPEEVHEMFVAVILSVMTSTIAFASMLTNPIPTLRDFGLYASFGTIYAGFAAVFVIYPLVKGLKGIIPEDFGRQFKNLFELSTIKYRKTILFISLCFLFSGLVIFRMEIETDYYRYYRSRAPMTEAVDFVNKTIGGQYPVMVLLETEKDEGILDYEFLKFLEKFKKKFEHEKGVDKIITYLDMLNEGYKAFENEVPADWFRDRTMVSQVAMTVRDANRDLNDYYSDLTKRKSLIFVRTNHINSKNFELVTEKIKSYVRAEAPPGVSSTAGGTYLRCVVSADNMAVSQMLSTFYAIGTLFLLVFVIIRSVRLTLLAFLANIVPVLGVYGILGLSGETLNMGTTTIADIALGIGVDDTIHFLIRYVSAMKRTGNSPWKSVRAVFENAGISITFTSLAISLSFLTLAGSNIKPIFQLGVFTSVTMALCVASNLFFLPYLVTAGAPKELPETNPNG